jgi:hypothetical protein
MLYKHHAQTQITGLPAFVDDLIKVIVLLHRVGRLEVAEGAETGSSDVHEDISGYPGRYPVRPRIAAHTTSLISLQVPIWI